MSVMLYPHILCIALLMGMFDNVCEIFGETIRNMFGCGCQFSKDLKIGVTPFPSIGRRTTTT